MDIISLQSHVSWGYVGNAVAIPLIEALGQRIWPINSVSLPHHPGHGPAERQVIEPSEIAEQLIEALGKSSSPVVFHMGYLGTREQGEAALSVIKDARNKGRDIVFHLDPAFGDTNEGAYVASEIIEFHLEQSLQTADIVKANAFEASRISNIDIASEADAIEAAKVIRQRGPKLVIITSVPAADNMLANVLVNTDQQVCTRVHKLDLRTKGTGDMFAAGFLAGLSLGDTHENAFARATSVVDLICRDATEHNLNEPDIDKHLPSLSPDITLIPVDILVVPR